jgi:hypothetical protein
MFPSAEYYGLSEPVRGNAWQGVATALATFRDGRATVSRHI